MDHQLKGVLYLRWWQLCTLLMRDGLLEMT